MSIWATLAGTAIGLVVGGPLGALAGAAAGGVVDGAITLARPEARNARRQERARVAFTIAAIALAAKMAKADGQATAAEFAVFQRLFRVDAPEAGNAARFYDLAKRSVAGFEAYADQAAELLGAGSPVLEDLLDALWMIAAVDGFAGAELAYLDEVARRFGFSGAAADRIRARHLPPDDPALAGDPRAEAWAVLGLPPGSDAAELKAAYHALVKRYHPDRALAEGVPNEFIRVSEKRMASINAAYDLLTGRR
jgi:DnaJ like chaperone protein